MTSLTTAAIAICAALLIPTAGQAGEAGPVPGVYSNLDYNQEAGDFFGLMVEFRNGPRPVVVVAECEGGCWGGREWPVQVTGRHIAFTVCDVSRDQDGRPLPCEKEVYAGDFRADGALVISLAGSHAKPSVLNRIKHPTPHMIEQAVCGADHCPQA